MLTVSLVLLAEVILALSGIIFNSQGSVSCSLRCLNAPSILTLALHAEVGIQIFFQSFRIQSLVQFGKG